MAELSYRSGVFLVLIAGAIWSTMGLMINYPITLGFWCIHVHGRVSAWIGVVYLHFWEQSCPRRGTGVAEYDRSFARACLGMGLYRGNRQCLDICRWLNTYGRNRRERAFRYPSAPSQDHVNQKP
jgi:hypothetical protein